jgi:transposase
LIKNSTRIQDAKVIVLLRAGKTPKQIAARLCLSVHQVYDAVRRNPDRRKSPRPVATDRRTRSYHT